jgi:hypothetical protein
MIRLWSNQSSQRRTIMPNVRRHVIGIKQDKMSGVIYSDNPEYQ